MTHLPPSIGHYEILGLLGTGGMAEVFLGRSASLPGEERPVVVKRILPHLARQRQFVDMFRDEAQIAARIHHPNVVEVYELGESGLELYLVMEYLGGESAAGIARQLARRKKLLSFGLCAHMISEVCGGLHAAHILMDDEGEPLNIVHRDVSPANIFVTYDGDVKILDFGIAVAANRLSKTDAGQVKGKYAYMSPEQCRGKTLDRRSDIFSLGTVLYELSTCRRLFKRPSDMETLEAVCNEEVVPPSRLVNKYPPELERICLKALQKDPDARYATALEMRRELLAVAAELNKGKTPSASIAKVMKKLFAGRIDQKSEMIQCAPSGEGVPSRALAVDEQSVEFPVVTHDPEAQSAALAEPLPFIGNTLDIGSDAAQDVDLQPNSASPSAEPTTNYVEPTDDDIDSSVEPVGWRPRTPLLLAVPLLAGLLAGVWWTSQQGGSASPVVAAGQVHIELDSVPSFAEVFRGEQSMGRTPLKLTFSTSKSPIPLTLRKEGFVDLEHVLVPTASRRLRVSLQPKPPSRF